LGGETALRLARNARKRWCKRHFWSLKSRALSHVLPLARLLCREDEEKKEEEEEEEENIMDDFSV
jgi:hypothetical protein